MKPLARRRRIGAPGEVHGKSRLERSTADVRRKIVTEGNEVDCLHSSRHADAAGRRPKVEERAVFDTAFDLLEKTLEPLLASLQPAIPGTECRS